MGESSWLVDLDCYTVLYLEVERNMPTVPSHEWHQDEPQTKRDQRRASRARFVSDNRKSVRLIDEIIRRQAKKITRVWRPTLEEEIE